MEERIQKIISSCGLMSRRAAEKMLSEGKVTVNGKVASLGDKAEFGKDAIAVDGVLVLNEPEKVYVMLNKPKGYVTTLSDEKGRKNVSELVEDAGVRLYPVGRLDINSEGLLIMTNDGEFTNSVTHPSGNVKKTYKVWVRSDSVKEGIERVGETMEIDGIRVRAQKVRVLYSEERQATLLITISEGRNRQIRKMCDQSGLYVTRLCRVKEGKLELGNLKPGEWRYLSPEEVAGFFE